MPDEHTLLEFPCQFLVKALGKNNLEIATRVFAIVCRHVPDLNFNAVKTRPSKADKYIAITIAIEASSKLQLDAIYQDLTDCDEVIMVL